MKRRKIIPIAKRSSCATSVRSAEPERLKDFVEDPLPEKRDMEAEQEAAFRPPEHSDPRVMSSESNQGRTR